MLNLATVFPSTHGLTELYNVNRWPCHGSELFIPGKCLTGEGGTNYYFFKLTSIESRVYLFCRRIFISLL